MSRKNEEYSFEIEKNQSNEFVCETSSVKLLYENGLIYVRLHGTYDVVINPVNITTIATLASSIIIDEKRLFSVWGPEEGEIKKVFDFIVVCMRINKNE